MRWIRTRRLNCGSTSDYANCQLKFITNASKLNGKLICGIRNMRCIWKWLVATWIVVNNCIHGSLCQLKFWQFERVMPPLISQTYQFNFFPKHNNYHRITYSICQLASWIYTFLSGKLAIVYPMTFKRPKAIWIILALDERTRQLLTSTKKKEEINNEAQ